ncbi:(d)CMP kinase [Leptolyngbya sp. 15MV]|nr:(d)CMP kinase [Leptolyngbya sp. 15MV]
MIIAVDGPTASGKGTIARKLAVHYGLPHLDTGLLYRAVGRQVALDGGKRLGRYPPRRPGDRLEQLHLQHRPGSLVARPPGPRRPGCCPPPPLIPAASDNQSD